MVEKTNLKEKTSKDVPSGTYVVPFPKAFDNYGIYQA